MAEPDTRHSRLLPLDSTRIPLGGNTRCCLETVAEEFRTPDHPGVAIGEKSQCRYCKCQFTLVDATPHPLWKPDWLLEKEQPVCRVCGGHLIRGQAFTPGIYASEEFGQPGTTMNEGPATEGPVSCLKCEKCGHSFIPQNNQEAPFK